MAKRPGLGKGLDALIPGARPGRSDQGQSVTELPIERILPNSPLGSGIAREGLAGIVMPRLGAGDF